MPKRWFLIGAILLLAFIWFAPASDHAAKTVDADETISAATDADEVYVYITKTGKKYHRDGCRYLKHSKILITLEDAKARGYEACKVCKPPK